MLTAVALDLPTLWNASTGHLSRRVFLQRTVESFDEQLNLWEAQLLVFAQRASDGLLDSGW